MEYANSKEDCAFSLVHYALPVRVWLRQQDFKPCGFGYGYIMESIKQVWKRVLRLLVLIHANCVISWGVVR